jgi:hypothetical protein
VLSSADLTIPDEVEGELRDELIDLTSPYALLTAVDGKAVECHPPSLRFSHRDEVVTFSIAAADGDSARFDFYAFVRQDGALDEAPSHVVFSAGANPWTYPEGGVPAAGKPYPTTSYADPADTTLSERPQLLLALVGGVLGVGALLAVVGWDVERHRHRHRTPRPRPSSG